MRTAGRETASRPCESHLDRKRVFDPNGGIVYVAVRAIGVRTMLRMGPDLHQCGMAAKLVTEGFDRW